MFLVFLAMICGISGSLTGDWNITLCPGPPVHKFPFLYIKNRYFRWGKDLKGRLGGAGERKRHILPPEYYRKLLSQEHQAPVTAAGRASCEPRDPGVWSGCLAAAGQSSWGVRTQSSACDPFFYPRAVFTELRAGKPLPNWYFLEEDKVPTSFLASTSPTGTLANWVFKWKHWNILQRPQQLGRKYDPMKGPAYWIKSIGSEVR